MGGTPLPQQVEELRAALRDAHAAAFPSLSDSFPHLFPPEAVRWERFLWAYAIVETRGLVVALRPGKGK